MKKIILAATAIGLMFASCKKPEQSAKSTNKATTNHSSAEGGCDPSNPANPADGAGLWHNNGCDYVLAYVNSTGDKSMAGIIAQVNRYGTETGVGTDPDLALHINIVKSDAYESYASAINAGTADPVIRAYATKLVSTIDGATFPDPSAIDYCDFKSLITDFEATVAADRSLTAAQQNTIYTMTSVARYSADKWWNGTIGSPKLPGGAHTPIDAPAYADAHKIIDADLVGALFGGWGAVGASAACWLLS